MRFIFSFFGGPHRKAQIQGFGNRMYLSDGFPQMRLRETSTGPGAHPAGGSAHPAGDRGKSDVKEHALESP
jgi:hypothetical protein